MEVQARPTLLPDLGVGTGIAVLWAGLTALALLLSLGGHPALCLVRGAPIPGPTYTSIPTACISVGGLMIGGVLLVAPLALPVVAVFATGWSVRRAGPLAVLLMLVSLLSYGLWFNSGILDVLNPRCPLAPCYQVPRTPPYWLK